MKLTIHVGVGKTGTTSIQKFLSENYDILLKSKILYSPFLNDNSKGYLKTLGPEPVLHLNNERLLLEKLSKLNKVLIEGEIEHFIWSNEAMYQAEYKFIKLIKKSLDYTSVNIVFYIRRQDSWFQSAFYQWGWKHKTYQGAYLINFEEFFEKFEDWGYYHKKIELWGSIFGFENINIQAFEKNQLATGLISNFCKLVGLEIDSNVDVGHGDCIHIGRAQIGEVTSSTRSPILGKNIALARVDVAHSAVGTRLEIGKLDGHQKRLPAVIAEAVAAYDPKKERPRS
jgi:hypothetical protein